MPKLPKFMHDIAANIAPLPQNTAPVSTDGSQVTKFDYTHGSKEVAGREPVGHKKVNAKSDHSVEGSSSGNNQQIGKRKKGYK